jgi:hypothetical protein
MTVQKKYRTIFVSVLLSLLVFLFVFFMYAFLHEAGHAIAGVLFGQSLTEFSVNFWNFNAHVGMTGGALKQTQLAIRAVAGASLPLLIWAVFMTVVPRNATFILELLKLLSSMTVVNTLLPWIILPILFLFGKAPADDVTNFLLYSQITPIQLTVLALILYAAGWLLFLSKIAGLRNEILLFRIAEPEKMLQGARKTMPVMAGTAAICVMLSFVLNGSRAGTPLDPLSPPPGFGRVAQIDLSARSYSAESIGQFTLNEPANVGVFLAVYDINTAYFDLRVTGPAGFSSGILHGEGYRTARDGGLWEQSLQPGTYQIVLTSHSSPGRAIIYLHAR